MKLNTETIARASSRHPWRTLGIWLVTIVAMGAITSSLLGDVLNQDIAFTSQPESVKAEDLLEEHFPEASDQANAVFFIVGSETATVDDPAFRAKVEHLQGEIAGLGEDVIAQPPVTYYDIAAESPEAAAGLVSQDGRFLLLSAELQDDTAEFVEHVREVAAEAGGDGFTVDLGGNPALYLDFSEIAEEDLRRGEGIGIAVALVVLIVVFASLVAALVPIVMAIFAIVVALGLVSLVGQLAEFNLFVTNMVSMIGLAVGIDYSLFIVSRYREERRKGFDKLGAIGAAGATANRAVFFSGLMVVLALLGMLIIPTTIFRSLAGGAIFVTLAALAASMTLLPAILALLGDRINWPRLSKRARLDGEHDPRNGAWDRLARGVMSHPVVYLLIGVALMGSLAAVAFDLHPGTSQSVSSLPDDFPSKQAFVILEQEFAGGLADPARIVVTGDVNGAGVDEAVRDLQAAIEADERFAPQTTVTPSEDGAVIEVAAFFRGDPNTDEAFAAIGDLRSEVLPAAFGGVEGVEVLVGGSTAFFTDFLSVADDYQWIVLAFVLGLSFILLTIVFRSLVVPVKAILLNLLSVGAAYGAVTLVFQKGVGIGFFNAIGFQFQQSESIEAWLPLFLFSILFGLSMDYHVFLLTRIREEYDRTGDNTESVAYGLRTTGSIITGAALIMVAVFIGFAAGRLGPLQQMGFGLAVAVLLDATIVRSILVPASMRLLGERNWYLPGWLQWLPDIHVEGHEPELAATAASAETAPDVSEVAT